MFDEQKHTDFVTSVKVRVSVSSFLCHVVFMLPYLKKSNRYKDYIQLELWTRH